MNKKSIFSKWGAIFAFAALVAAFPSCSEDYQSDIDSLSDRVTAVEDSLASLEAQINAGSVITDVTSTTDGILITLSNGQSYEITNGTNGVDGTNGTNGTDGTNGTNGTNGTDGAAGSVVTIGDNGNWYIDGVDSGLTSIGATGATGETGATGAAGADGKDGVDGTDGASGGIDGVDGAEGTPGKYYYPDSETGTFIEYVWDATTGEYVAGDDTGIPFAASDDAIVAVYDESTGTVTLYYVVGDNGETLAPITLGANSLTSIAFIPSVLSGSTYYPTTTDPFYHVATYNTESKYVATTYKFIPQGWDLSNGVKMSYRLNPTSANVEGIEYAFINRNVTVTTRAAGDFTDLLTVYGSTTASGVAEITALYNNTASTASADSYDIVALQATVSGEEITSDYVEVTSTPIVPELIDLDAYNSTPSTIIYFYDRDEAITTANKETSDFIKEFVTLLDPANLQFNYQESIDLNDYVTLYSDDFTYDTATVGLLANKGFSGISYVFSLPEEYLENDTQNTNQQWFVELNSGVVKVNSANLTNSLTPAIGRTPVVRVDAYMTSNNGGEQMVASAYIKLSIVEGTVVTPSVTEMPDNKVYIDANAEFIYQNLTSTNTLVGQMDWTEVNNEVYGLVGLTSTNFWDYYGGTSNEYTVELNVTNGGLANPLISDTGVASNSTVTFVGDGVTTEVLLHDNATTTSNIAVSVDNTVMTDLTYTGVSGMGAEYTLTITIESDQPTLYGDFVLTQVFYVKNNYDSFYYNPLYWFNTYKNYGTADYVQVKGQVISNSWVMSSYIGEHFEQDSYGNDIFTYALAGSYNNVNGVDIDVNSVNSSDAEVDVANNVVLKDAMSEDDAVVKMDNTVTYVNGEVYTDNYYVVFVNPFVDMATDGIKIAGNTIGTVTEDIKYYVGVEENVADGSASVARAIYGWNYSASALELTATATGVYKITNNPSVTYAFADDAAYQYFTGNLTSGSTLTVSSNGVVTWDNQGTTLQDDHYLTVEATVTFANLSKVTVEIPVTILK